VEVQGLLPRFGSLLSDQPYDELTNGHDGSQSGADAVIFGLGGPDDLPQACVDLVGAPLGLGGGELDDVAFDGGELLRLSDADAGVLADVVPTLDVAQVGELGTLESEKDGPDGPLDPGVGRHEEAQLAVERGGLRAAVDEALQNREHMYTLIE
jgi:hypothetical protein